MKKVLRFHLITLIVVQLAAAGLLWANLREKATSGGNSNDLKISVFGDVKFVQTISQGWPAAFNVQRSGTFKEYGSPPDIPAFPINDSQVHWSMVWLDAIVWLMLLGGTAVLSEYPMRRRKRAAP